MSTKLEEKWEVRDRHYLLRGNLKPLTYRLQSKSSSRRPLMYYDEDKGYERELK